MKKRRKKKIKSRKISIVGYYKVYVKCKKCKRNYTIEVYGEDRKEWWQKNGRKFVCLLCDLEAKWAKDLTKSTNN